jgi:hypothetical protein
MVSIGSTQEIAMDRSFALEAELYNAVAAAYRRARLVVYDVLPAGATIHLNQLTELQRDALYDLTEAEADLVYYRRRAVPPQRTRSCDA